MLTPRSKFWRQSTEDGRPGWQRIVLTLIADGLQSMDTSVMDILATMGVYQDGVLKKAVDGKPTVAHIFEVSGLHLSQNRGFMSVEHSVHDATVDRCNAPTCAAASGQPGQPGSSHAQTMRGISFTHQVPVQMIFVLKQANSKKINSHRWLFNALGRQLRPEICVLLDAGTKPGRKAIYHRDSRRVWSSR